MNSIRVQLLKLYPEAIETFGYITKEHRQLMALEKTHSNDAVAITSFSNIERTQATAVSFDNHLILLKRCVPKGDYQQTKGSRSEKKIPTGKLHGFRKFDKVKYLGQSYFIKGRMSSGYTRLMSIDNTEIKFDNAPKGMKTPKFKNMTRISARKAWLMIEVSA